MLTPEEAARQKKIMELKVALLKKKYPNGKVVKFPTFLDLHKKGLFQSGEEAYIVPVSLEDGFDLNKKLGSYSVSVVNKVCVLTSPPNQTFKALLRSLSDLEVNGRNRECCVCMEKEVNNGCPECLASWCEDCRRQFVKPECPVCRHDMGHTPNEAELFGDA